MQQQNAKNQTAGQKNGATDQNAIIYNGDATPIDIDATRAALKSGKTIAIKNAKAGQLSELYPGLGCEVPCDLPLFAIKQFPIPDHPGKMHTIITIVHGNVNKVEAQVRDETGRLTKIPAAAAEAAPSDDLIQQELTKHIDMALAVNSGLTPPTQSSYFGTVTYNHAFWGPLTQNFWSDNNGSAQTYYTYLSQTYYCYFVQLSGGDYGYYVLLVHSGYVTPAGMGSNICCNDWNARCFMAGFYSVTNTIGTGGSTLVASSPVASKNDPVEDTVSVSMNVMKDWDGQSAVPFTAGYDNMVPNTDWGVIFDGSASPNVTWTYYNVTGWNALTNTFDTFGNWWSQMYESDNDATLALDNQCQTSASYEVIDVWSLLANPGNASLPVSFTADVNIAFQGFANRQGSGDNHHQMYQGNLPFSFPPVTFDLVVITGSGSVQ